MTSRKTDLLLFLLAAGWLASLVYFAGGMPPVIYNSQRFLSLLLLSGLVIIGLHRPVPALSSASGGLAGAILLAVLFVGVVTGRNWYFWREVCLILLVIMAARSVAGVRLIAGRQFDNAAMLGVPLICLGLGLIVLQSLFFYLYVGVLEWQLVFEAFFNVRYFSHLQGWSLLILPAASLYFHDAPGKRRLTLLVAALWWGLLFLSGSRSVLVAVIGALIGMWILLPALRKAWWLAVAWSAGVGLLFYLGLLWLIHLLGLTLPSTMTFGRDWAAAGGRWDIWRHVWDGTMTAPWTGPGNDLLSCGTGFVVSHEHNVVLLLAAALGWPVTLLIGALVVRLLYQGVMFCRSHPDNPVAIGLLAVWLTVLIQSLFTGNYITPISMLFCALMLGWTWGYFSTGEPGQFSVGEPGQVSPVRRSLAWALSGIVLAAVLFMVLVDIDVQHALIFQGNKIYMNFSPRVWAMGDDWCP